MCDSLLYLSQEKILSGIRAPLHSSLSQYHVGLAILLSSRPFFLTKTQYETMIFMSFIVLIERLQLTKSPSKPW
jgi:hypothetical protein